MAKIYFNTPTQFKVYWNTIDQPVYKIYFNTPTEYKVYFNTPDVGTWKIYFNTPSFHKIYFNTTDLDTTSFPNECDYPTELEELIKLGILEVYDLSIACLRDSILKESYGKTSLTGYDYTGNLLILLDYLTHIWLERNYDSLNNIEREEEDYYYTKYELDEVILQFKKLKINVKPLIEIFDLKVYEILDNDFNEEITNGN